jgi:hypothetical protein
MPKLISIPLANRFNIKFDEFYLNAYSLKKYKTPYQDSKSKVNADIKKLSEQYKTVKMRDMKMLLLSELLPKKENQMLKSLHVKEITKFD